MDRITIAGGSQLKGVIPISGAKNATLPLMIVSLLTPDRLRREPDSLAASQSGTPTECGVFKQGELWLQCRPVLSMVLFAPEQSVCSRY